MQSLRKQVGNYLYFTLPGLRRVQGPLTQGDRWILFLSKSGQCTCAVYFYPTLADIMIFGDSAWSRSSVTCWYLTQAVHRHEIWILNRYWKQKPVCSIAVTNWKFQQLICPTLKLFITILTWASAKLQLIGRKLRAWLYVRKCRGYSARRSKA